MMAELCPSLGEGPSPIENILDHLKIFKFLCYFLVSRLNPQKSFNFFPDPDPPNTYISFLCYVDINLILNYYNDG